MLRAESCLRFWHIGSCKKNYFRKKSEECDENYSGRLPSYTGERAAADLRYIGQHLDHGVMARFGYKLLRKCVAVPAYSSTARRAVCKEEAPAHEHFPRYPSTKDVRAPSDVWKGHVASYSS